MKKVILIGIAVVVIVVVYFYFNGNNSIGTLFASDTLKCPEVDLKIESIECKAGLTGVKVNVSRSEDLLGDGLLKVNATDEKGTAYYAARARFNASQSEEFYLAAFAGEKTEIVAWLEFKSENETKICGVRKVKSCSELSDEEKILSEGEKSDLERMQAEQQSSPSQPGSSQQTADLSVPNPSGTVSFMDIPDSGSDYFCNQEKNPVHGIKVYTYRNINNNETLSNGFIESSKVSNVCESYGNKSEGVRYGVRWSWPAVAGVDGYKVYQYYSLENMTIDYSRYIRILNSSHMLVDNGFELWHEN